MFLCERERWGWSENWDQTNNEEYSACDWVAFVVCSACGLHFKSYRDYFKTVIRWRAMVIFPLRNISATINATFHLQKLDKFRLWRDLKPRLLWCRCSFVSPCPPECNFQSETKIEPDLRLLSTNNWEKVIELVQFFIKPWMDDMYISKSYVRCVWCNGVM